MSEQVTSIKGVGEELSKKFRVLGIETIQELLYYFPRRYEDYSQVMPVVHFKPGMVTMEGHIGQVKNRYVRRGMHITEALASDATGSIRLIWFNQPYRESSLKRGAAYYISGKYELNRQRFSIMNPAIELVSEFPVNTARIVPVYRETKGLTSKQIRTVLRQTLVQMRRLPETLPHWLIKEQGLMSRSEAVKQMHFPQSMEKLTKAKYRLGFEEVFRLTLASLLNKQENQRAHSTVIQFQEELAKDFVKHLPFKLTDAQRKVIWQVYQDLQREQPMNRLIEGDVGSGKTVVAAMAALMVMAEDYQVALMAPTELLARQHAETIYNLLKPLGKEHQVSLLVGGMSKAQKEKAHAAIASGAVRFIVGTHALIQEKVDMHRLALVVIDEQHRFGVEQRKTLMAKAGHMPHLLSLTATPIPRSLALTLYGELDISIIATKPANRKPIRTQIISPNSRASLYAKIVTELEAGRQMFVVCPLISDSEQTNAHAAEKVYEQMKRVDFKTWRVGLLHGKMKPNEKNEVMRQFVAHDLDILVSTTVIEVGVDVPNATVMLIENADRFGLAQMHQLRGRVGRSEHQGYCYLLMSDSSAPSKRLRALESSDNGFKLAELDLELRGPGAIYGAMQHGQLDLRIAQLTDTELIASARAAAQAFIDKQEDLVQYTDLAQAVTELRKVTNLN